MMRSCVEEKKFIAYARLQAQYIEHNARHIRDMCSDSMRGTIACGP